MAENLRSEYMTKVSIDNSKGLRRIRALQRFFQANDEMLYLQTKLDRRLYRGVMAFSVAAIGISLFSLFQMASGTMKPKRS